MMTVFYVLVFFFFSSRRRHTRFDCDWSSDVCSSDLDRFVKPRRVLAVLAASELCGMAPWFSASAVAPALSRAWRLDSAGGGWVAVSVEYGFFARALVVGLLSLS